MSTPSRLAFASLVTTGELAGMMLGIGLTQFSAQTLPETCWTTRQQASDALSRKVMPGFFGITAVSLAGATVGAGGKQRALLAAATLSFLAVLGGTVGLNVPINIRIAAWTPGSAPADWTNDRDRWLQAHWLRTAFGALAFVCSALSLEVDGRDSRS